MMNYTVELVSSLRVVWFARNGQYRLDLDDVIVFCEVHVPFAENKPLQVDY